MGSALEITRKLAGFIEIKPTQKPVAPNRIQAVTKLGIPEPSKLSPLLLNLDLRRLNALEMRELSQIIESLDKKKRDGSFAKSEVVVQPGELFEIDLKIKNRSAQQVVARIGHLIEPRDVTNFLDFVECGFLLPVTLEPGKEHAYSARYLLRDNIPEGVRELSLTYDFRLLK